MKRTHWVIVAALASAICALPLSVASATARPPASSHRVAPRGHATVKYTYTVSTTTDADLAGGAPAHRCEAAGDIGKCSLRAAFEVVNDDFADSPGSWDVIKVPAGTFVLRSAVDGDALDVSENGSLTVEGAGDTKSVIDGSTATFSNELIDIYANDDVVLSNLELEGGEQNYGAQVNVAGSSSLSVANCFFTGGDAYDDGGSVYFNGSSSLSVTGSTFTHDDAEYVGGAVYVSSNSPAVFSNDSFAHDGTIDFGSPESSYNGGAVYSTNAVEIDHSDFTSNEAVGDGGAVHAGEDSVLSYDTFTSNISYDSDGGAVFADDSITVTNSTFQSNTAGSDGGGMYNDESAVVANDTFTSNRADDDGGDVFDDYDDDVTGSSFSKSTAENAGGGIYVGGSSSVFATDDSFTDEQVLDGSSSDGGGAIYLPGMTYSVLNNDTVTGNKADAGIASGGGVDCQECLVVIEGGTYSHNHAAKEGGGVYFDSSTDENTITGATIDDNVAAEGGGVQIEDEAIVSIQGSTIDGNDAATGQGGGVAVNDQSQLDLATSTVADNKADGAAGYGGAISADDYEDPAGSDVTLFEDTLVGNSAIYGGAIYSYGPDTDVGIDSSTIVGNIEHGPDALDAGGIYNNSSFATSTDSIWAGNTGDQCYELSVSGGNNLDSDNSCGFHNLGDVTNTPSDLLGLANNGGPTETLMPLATSLAINGGGSSCARTDQRGVSVPNNQTCSIGSVFAEGTTTKLTLSPPLIVKGHEQVEKFKLTVSAKVSGNKPAGLVKILDGTKVVCTASVKVVSGSIATGSCSPGPNTVPTGTHKLQAEFAGSGVLGASESASVSIKVT